MRVQFVLSEIRIGLRRNLTMSVAVIITVAISLALLGNAWLIRQQVNEMKSYWFDKIQVSVFLTDNVTDAQRKSINQTLVALPDVQHVFYESKQEAYQHFKHDFRDSPDLVKNTSPDALPESFRVKLKDPRKYDIVASAMQGQPGVLQVTDDSAVLKKFFRLLHGLQVAAYVAAGILLVATVLLIYNAIRVAAFSRRRETGIMRLVGASDFYIQLPFILEGAVAGLVGGVFATGAVVALKALLIDRSLRPAFRFTSFIGWDAVWQMVPVLLLVGVALAAVASFLTLRRHLRV